MSFISKTHWDALAAAQGLFDKCAQFCDPILDPHFCKSYLVWNYDANPFHHPRNSLHAILLAEIGSFRVKSFKQFAACDVLKIWDATKLCREFHLFQSGNFFCVQLIQDTPYFIKIRYVRDTVTVFLNERTAVSFERFLQMLVAQYPDAIPNDEHLHQYWLATGKKFNWVGLPNELKWLVIEQLSTDDIISPYFYKRGHPYSHYDSIRETELYATMPAHFHQVELTMPGQIFYETPMERDMIDKTGVRRNCFYFDRPSSLARWLSEMNPAVLKQVRTIRLNFTHGDFMRFWSSDLQPHGRGHGSYVHAAKQLGNMYLEKLTLEPQVSEDMKIHSYFSEPQLFGCHARAVGYIAGLATRHLPNTKRIVFYGNYIRLCWQPILDDMFSRIKLAKSKEDFEELYAEQRFQPFSTPDKLKAIMEREKQQCGGDGGVKVTRRRSMPNKAITESGEQQFEQGSDLPQRQGSEEENDDEILWACKCHVRCREDYFDNRNPPPPRHRVVRKKVEPETQGPSNSQQQEEEEASQDGQEDKADNWLPENTEYNGAAFWLV